MSGSKFEFPAGVRRDRPCERAMANERLCWPQMARAQIAVASLVLLALSLQSAVAVISRNTQVEGFATFYGGPQVSFLPVDGNTLLS